MDGSKSDQQPTDLVSILTPLHTDLGDVIRTDVLVVPLTPTSPPPPTPESPSTPPSTTPSTSTQNILLHPQIIQPQSQPALQQSDQVDPQILEALKSKDRIFVLKLGETFEALIKESRPRVELTPNSSYHRLLVHRCSAYYKLVPESDPHTKGISVVCTSESRIPDRRLCDLIPPEPHTHPAIQIMRRPRSLASSVAGEEADLSDVEPSESGSLGGRSNLTSSSANHPIHLSNAAINKKHMTIEEREAAYKMARERIFMDFQEKPEKGKGKDAESGGVVGVSASLSLLSLTGGGAGSTSASVSSTSAGGRSSFLGDTDDAASSPATESEWSGPVATVGGGHQSRGESHGNKREGGRRAGPGSTSASSSRSLRNERGFHGSGSGSSSRNSRAPSPSSSFAYPTLYEPPPPAGQIYDPNQHHQIQQQLSAANAAAAAAGMGYMNPANQYTTAYQYPGAPGQGHTQTYMAPAAYPYYAQPYHPYPMQHLPPQAQQTHPGQHSAGDHTSPPPPPPGSEPYSPQHQPQHPINYGHPYVWGQPAPHPQTMQSPPPPSHVHPIAHHHVHPTHPSHAQTHQQSHNPASAHNMGPPPPPPPPGPPPPQQAPNPAGAYPGYPAYVYPAQPMPMNGYYPPPGAPQQVPVGSMPPGAPQQGPLGQQQHGYIDPRSMNGQHVSPQGHLTSPGHHNPNNAHGGQNQRSGYVSADGSMNGGRNNRSVSNAGGGGGGVGKARPGPPGATSTRAPWSYGPSVGGGPSVQGGGYGHNVTGGSDTNLGPRFTTNHRRPSGNSSSGNSRGSSNFDDTLSISSTSTSSSSTSTNTLVSTASSQHPLPQRPDWAVGLKAQPSLAGNRHMSASMSSSPMRTSSHNSGTSSTSSNGSNRTSPMPPASTDFPPLTTGPAAVGEKKVPVPGGAWGVPRNVTLGLSGADGERGSGRSGDIISPKIVRRPSGPQQPPNGGQGYHAQQGHSPQQGQFDRTRDAANATIEQVSGMTLDENEADATQVSTPVVASTSPAAAAASLAASALAS